MDEDEKIREAQKILDWAIKYLNVSINGKITAYKHNN
jgi:hypothetical protein